MKFLCIIAMLTTAIAPTLLGHTDLIRSPVALRLAFRQPEGITRLNATRLNSFIQENRRSLDFEQVAKIVKEWGIENWVENNLILLYRRSRVRILNDGKIILGIERKIKARQQK